MNSDNLTFFQTADKNLFTIIVILSRVICILDKLFTPNQFPFTLNRFCALFLLSILLFNNIGFSVICNILKSKSDLHFEAKLDANQYNEAHLIEIKIPLKLPYTTEWKNFERYDGEIKVNGLYYKYVKRKVIIDSLVLLCLPNPTKLRLESARDDAFELVNG